MESRAFEKFDFHIKESQNRVRLWNRQSQAYSSVMFKLLTL
jgi:hypothetical protein